MSTSPFFLCHSLPCRLGEALSLNLDCGLASPAGQQVLVIFLSLCHRLQNGPTSKVFVWVLGFLTQSSFLQGQDFIK